MSIEIDLRPIDLTEPERTEKTDSGLPPALEVLVSQYGLERAIALDLERELEYQAMVVKQHREMDQKANLVYLDNGGSYERYAGIHKISDEKERIEAFREAVRHLPVFDPSAASFDGDVSLVGQHIIGFAEIAHNRFAERTNMLMGEKKSLAIDLGFEDQQGDWGASVHLDARVEAATDVTVLQTLARDASVTKHSREHPRINYEFWRTDGEIGDRAAVVVIRKRPYADIEIQCDGEPVCVEVFRKSWFVVSTNSRDNPELYRHIKNIQLAVAEDHDSKQVISDYVSDMLAPESVRPEGSLAVDDKQKQSYVIPCTMTYVAQIRNPNLIKTGVQ